MSEKWDKERKDAFWKHPITIIICAALVVVGLYYLMSPYQKCTRMMMESDYMTKAGAVEICIERTSW